LTTVGVGTTDTGGQVTLGLADGTNEIIVTASGYSTISTSLVVSGNASRTYSLDEVVINPSSNPLTVTGYFTIYDNTMSVVTGQDIVYRVVTHPIGLGYGFNQAWRTVTSNSLGVVQMPDMLKGATYAYGATTDAVESHSVPISDETEQPMPNIIIPVEEGK